MHAAPVLVAVKEQARGCRKRGRARARQAWCGTRKGKAGNVESWPAEEVTEDRTGLEHDAMVALLRALGPDEERSTGRVLEHLPNTLARPCRALEIVTSTDLLCYRHAL